MRLRGRTRKCCSRPTAQSLTDRGPGHSPKLPASYKHVATCSRMSVRCRITTFGEFQTVLREAVRVRAPSLFGTRIDVSGAAAIELRWAASSDEDLDLHVAIAQADNSTTISYEYRNETRAEPFAWLCEDIRSGPGPEVVEIGRWLAASYGLSVKNYSGGELSVAGPEVTIRWQGGTATYSCPAGSGAWWDVAVIDGATGEVTAVDSRHD